jgi:hypothetical protein
MYAQDVVRCPGSIIHWLAARCTTSAEGSLPGAGGKAYTTELFFSSKCVLQSFHTDCCGYKLVHGDMPGTPNTSFSCYITALTLHL